MRFFDNVTVSVATAFRIEQANPVLTLKGIIGVFSSDLPNYA